MNDIFCHYRKEFALLPIQVDSGDFCWFEHFYTEIETILCWNGYYSKKDIKRISKAEYVIERLKGV